MSMTRALTRRNLLLTGGATLVAAATAACSSSASSSVTSGKAGTSAVPIRIPDPGNAGVLAAGKKDGSLASALAKAGGRVQWTGSSGPFAPAAQEMDAGELDVAQGSITSAITALAQSPGFKLFARIAPDKLGEGILVRKDSPISSVRDLVGKKVAVNKGGTGEYLLLKALANANIPPSQVTRVYLNPAQTAAVFSSGQVDAWATWSTYSIAQVAQGARFVATGGEFGSQNYSVWAVRTEFAATYPKILQAFYQYLHASTLKEIANPGAYVNVFTTSGPQALSAAEITVNDTFASAGGTVNPVTGGDLKNFSAVADFFATQKVIPATVDITPYVVGPA
jgi:sulfonate transport system substrate-binding protein